MSEVERRKALRFNMALPLSVIDDTAGLQVRGVTRDISSSGLSWFSTIELPVGATLTFDLKLPFEVTLADDLRAQCKGHVVRVEPNPDGRGFVISVRIDKFEFADSC